jgi:hypothetical protein
LSETRTFATLGSFLLSSFVIRHSSCIWVFPRAAGNGWNQSRNGGDNCPNQNEILARLRSLAKRPGRVNGMRNCVDASFSTGC